MTKKASKKTPCISENPCKGYLTAKRIDYKVRYNGQVIIVPNVEVLECDHCKERFYPYESSKKIDLHKEYSGRLMLRLDPELHFKLVRFAKKHHRSLNQEINHLIDNAL